MQRCTVDKDFHQRVEAYWLLKNMDKDGRTLTRQLVMSGCKRKPAKDIGWRSMLKLVSRIRRIEASSGARRSQQRTY